MTAPRTEAGRALLEATTWEPGLDSEQMAAAIRAVEDEAARIDPERLALAMHRVGEDVGAFSPTPQLYPSDAAAIAAAYEADR